MSQSQGRADAVVESHRYDDLTVHVAPSMSALATVSAEHVARVLIAAVAARGEANAMFATGNSQLGMLVALADLTATTGAIGAVPWPSIRIFHMDEYVGMRDDHPASFARYIRERIVDTMHPQAVHYVDGDAAAGASAECGRYTDLLRAHPLDLCVMGIGENGHLAFNDPPVADFADPEDVKIVDLDEACRLQQVGEGHFAGLDDVPRQAITVTIPALLRARRVIVVCPEKRKAPAVARALNGPIDTTCPASVLRRQPHADLYLDAEAASLLPEGRP